MEQHNCASSARPSRQNLETHPPEPQPGPQYRPLHRQRTAKHIGSSGEQIRRPSLGASVESLPSGGLAARTRIEPFQCLHTIPARQPVDKLVGLTTSRFYQGGPTSGKTLLRNMGLIF